MDFASYEFKPQTVRNTGYLLWASSRFQLHMERVCLKLVAQSEILHMVFQPQLRHVLLLPLFEYILTNQRGRALIPLRDSLRCDASREFVLNGFPTVYTMNQICQWRNHYCHWFTVAQEVSGIPRINHELMCQHTNKMKLPQHPGLFLVTQDNLLGDYSKFFTNSPS